MVLESIDRLVGKARPYVPFTPPNTAWRLSEKKVKSILDIGCGTGEPMKFFMRHGCFRAVGIDIHLPYLIECKTKGTHDDYVFCDARKLPFKTKSFDLVLCLEVLEHLEKQEGKKLIGSLEEAARCQVIISTPLGRQIQGSYHNNPYQEHRSGWAADEFIALGFVVKGLGFHSIRGRRITDALPKWFRLLGHILYVLAGPFVYFFPESGGTVVCTKRLPNGRL